MTEHGMTRREFMERTAAAAAGAGITVGACWAGARAAEPDKSKIPSYSENMEYRRLGKTGLWVSAVCLGGHWKRIDKVLPGTEIKSGRSPFDQNRHDVVSRCIDEGINHVDACTVSEVRAYSKALKGRRDKMYIACSWSDREMRNDQCRKVGVLLETLDDGMKESGLDHVDLWRITMHERSGRHTDGEVEEMMKALETARKQGKVRFTGLSSHDRPHIKRMIEKYPEMVQVVCTPYTADSRESPTDSLFETVRKHDVGIFGIKPFASNSLFKGDGSPDSPHAEEDDCRARLAIRNILANPAITAPIPGLISVHQVDNVVKAVQERRQLGRQEKAELKEAAEQMWANLPDDYQWLKDWKYV